MTAAAMPSRDATVWTRSTMVLGALAIALLALFVRDVTGLATIWWTSSTFAHCLLIPPIIGWLVWQRAAGLARLAPVAWAPGLALVAIGATGWAMGEAAGVALARHLGLILMLQGAVIACLGPAVSRALAFPIGYALFLVPFGDALVPPLQTLTARMCMVLLDLAGVPAKLDGIFITIPNGWFAVAEACSGVKFLVAMAAYGALVANVCFVSWRRRALFMAAALALPVLANGVRAWGTIYVAHLTDARAAEGFDHVVYGWLFFGVVIALLMAGGWRWFDRPAGAPWFDPRVVEPVLPVQRYPIGGVAAGALAIAAAPMAWLALADARGTAEIGAVSLPVVPGWRQVPGEASPEWRARFDGADAVLTAHYADASGARVDIVVAHYARQREGREMVGYGQGAIDPAGPWRWADNSAPVANGTAFRIMAPGPVEREVAAFYRIGGITTGSGLRVKLETLKMRLTGGSQRAAAILVSAVDHDKGDARAAINRFLAALGPVDRLAEPVAGT
jgi:exosortase A